ncbi:hypothetical protein [Metabacillus litoralis]|uniref:hypothetical protein n=1 Tax=Metabacillus litoralis TaxID=152268 RepID=UPI00203BB483|nr:hypothetical protein [Metabacillus litoralis]MCM3411219.1 hypothetical protein [Metabacillus litoralis]
MLTYYRYKVEKGMMDISEVPQPYQDMLSAEMNPPTQEPTLEADPIEETTVTE